MSRLVSFSIVVIISCGDGGPCLAAFEVEPGSALPGSTGREGTPDLFRGSCFRWRLGHHLPFGLPELAGHSLTVGFHGVEAGLTLRGPARHREISTRVGGGWRMSRRLSTTAALTRYHLQQSHHTSRTYGLSLSVRLALSESFSLFVAGRTDAGDHVQPRIAIRFHRYLSGEGSAVAVVDRRGHSPPRLHMAAERQFDPRFRLSLGTSSSPRQFAVGWGSERGAHFVGYGVRTHATLGPSHAVAIGRSCACDQR